MAGLLIGYVAFHGSPEQIAAGSPTGTVFNSAKIAMVNWVMSTGATSTSVYNGDASDRYIQGFNYGCSGVGSSFTPLTGAGIANFSVSAATTSTNAPATIANTNFVLNTVFATSTPDQYVGSSTPGLTGNAFVRRWAAGSYLTIFSSATNTAACTIGVDYFPS